MRLNNMINSPTDSSGRTAFTTTITATTTAPTPGTIATNVSYYLQMGKTLFVTFNYSTTTGGNAGSGTYLFSIPTGFTINTSIVPINASGIDAALGSGTALQSPYQSTLVPYVYDSTHYAILAYTSVTLNFNPISNGVYALSFPVAYSINLRIPIL